MVKTALPLPVKPAERGWLRAEQEKCSLQGEYRHENRGIPRRRREPQAPPKVSNFLTWEFIPKRKFSPQWHIEMGPSSWDTSVFVPKPPRIVVPIVPERPPWRGRASIRSASKAHPGCLSLASLNFLIDVRRFCRSLPVRCQNADERNSVAPDQKSAAFSSLFVFGRLSQKPAHIGQKGIRDESWRCGQQSPICEDLLPPSVRLPRVTCQKPGSQTVGGQS